MPQPTVPTPLVYPELPMERLARAQCSHCGTELWAAHLIWIAQPARQGYRALCASCYHADHANGDSGPAAPPLTAEERGRAHRAQPA
jgi:hypothetical protein